VGDEEGEYESATAGRDPITTEREVADLDLEDVLPFEESALGGAAVGDAGVVHDVAQRPVVRAEHREEEHEEADPGERGPSPSRRGEHQHARGDPDQQREQHGDANGPGGSKDVTLSSPPHARIKPPGPRAGQTRVRGRASPTWGGVGPMPPLPPPRTVARRALRETPRILALRGNLG